MKLIMKPIWWVLIGCVLALEGPASAQVCSAIGQQMVYCDTADGATIIAPLGPTRGIILGPSGTDQFTIMPAPGQPLRITPSSPGLIYLDRETRSEPWPSPGRPFVVPDDPVDGLLQMDPLEE